MRRSISAILFAAILTSVSFSQVARAQASAPANPQYKKITEIRIGGAGNWDYLSVEPGGNRLFVSHGTKVEVIDLKENKKIGEVANTPGVHGFIAVPDLKRGYSSNGQGNNVSFVDLDVKEDPAVPLIQYKTLKTVTTGGNPDAILFVPKASGDGEIWTSNGRGNTLTMLNAKTGDVVADKVATGGKPESSQADLDAGKVYVNIEDKSEVIEVDIKEHKVTNHWPLGEAKDPTGMALVKDLHRLIIGASSMVLMDSTNGKVVATLKCGAGVDAAAYDPGTHLAFVSAGGDGTVTIAKVEADKLTLVQTLTTERRAKTMTLDPQTHRIYLSSSDNQGFKVLVYGLSDEKP